MTMRAGSQSRFVGSKGGAGIAQWIISNMPAHAVYVEAFLGRGIVMQKKLSSREQIGIEADPIVIARFWPKRLIKKVGLSLLCGDALTILPALQRENKIDSATLIYADPPYLGTARMSKNRKYYGCELLTVADHNRLLDVLTGLRAMVMLSGYFSNLYADRLAGWSLKKKWTVNIGGQRVEECLWMNFGAPIWYHDSRFAGVDFTERQGIKRKVERWKSKFLKLPQDERAAVVDALSSAIDEK